MRVRITAHSVMRWNPPKGWRQEDLSDGPSQRREAVREAELDEDEGADWIVIEPATLYLDIIREVRDHVSVPVSAYNVSGEYAMLKAAVKMVGWKTTAPW